MDEAEELMEMFDVESSRDGTGGAATEYHHLSEGECAAQRMLEQNEMSHVPGGYSAVGYLVVEHTSSSGELTLGPARWLRLGLRRRVATV